MRCTLQKSIGSSVLILCIILCWASANCENALGVTDDLLVALIGVCLPTLLTDISEILASSRKPITEAVGERSFLCKNLLALLAEYYSVKSFPLNPPVWRSKILRLRRLNYYADWLTVAFEGDTEIEFLVSCK